MALDLNALITPSIVISILGLSAYYFGRIIAITNPNFNNDKFNYYLNGILFVIVGVLFPILIAYTVFTSTKQINYESWKAFFFVVPILYFSLKTKWKRISKLPLDIDHYIVSAFALLGTISVYSTSTLDTIWFIGQNFIVLTLSAIFEGMNKAKDIYAEVVDIDGTKTKGLLKEGGGKFTKILDENRTMYIIPTIRIKSVKMAELHSEE